MTKKFFLLIILIILLISTLTLFFIFNYLDPYRNELLSIIILTTTITLFITSLSSLALYIFKKVYYRGEVFLSHIFSSLRQWFLISFFVIWVVLFKIVWVLSVATVLLFLLILFFMEMMFQNF